MKLYSPPLSMFGAKAQIVATRRAPAEVVIDGARSCTSAGSKGLKVVIGRGSGRSGMSS